jgi:beta-lactamase superfamily II metal-dependent hydrolase
MERVADIPPDDNQIEVSVFGPGYGESIAIHVGNGVWIIVDCCINPFSGQPAPLEYLERIGVDPASSVRLIVATHWHDDHIRGLGKVFRACKRADFSCSAALQRKQFLALVQACGTRHMMSSSGVDEFFEIHSAMADRARETASSRIHPKWAIADRLLWQECHPSATVDPAIHVYALSPSDAAVSRSLEEIAGLMPTAHSPKKRVTVSSPNHFAVVVWVNIQGIILLLGSDLEETNDPSTGWAKIVGSTTRPAGQACLFKVPHHGSRNADHPSAWSNLVEPLPLCVLTPFWRGSTKLPRRNDIERIMRHTDNAFISADLKAKKLKRPKPVEEMLKGAVRSIHPLHSSFGHVRVRSSTQMGPGALAVDLFGDAIPLSAFQGR